MVLAPRLSVIRTAEEIALQLLTAGVCFDALSSKAAASGRATHLWPQLSADVVGVQGEERLPRPDVQHPLVVGQGQRAVVGHALDAEPRHAVQHVCRTTEAASRS